MPREHSRTDRLLDDIDSLVNDSLSAGDQSQSFHGEQMDACPWCGEQWHFLPITQTMVDMRRGSYGRDEFGQGIVDPNYDYRKDTSRVVCPGSEYQAPEHWTKLWDKEAREKNIYIRRHNHTEPHEWPAWTHEPLTDEENAEAVARGWIKEKSNATPVDRFLPHATGIIRFVKPFDHWTLITQQEVVIAQITPSSIPQPIGQIIKAIFTYDCSLDLSGLNADEFLVWYNQNAGDIDHSEGAGIRYSQASVLVDMKPIVFEIDTIEAHFDSSDPAEGEEPNFVRLFTDYNIREQHPWAAEWFEVERPPDATVFDLPDGFYPVGTINADGLILLPYETLVDEALMDQDLQSTHDPQTGQPISEPSYAIIDETYEHTQEELDEYFRTCLRPGSVIYTTEGSPSSSQEDRSSERRQAIFYSSTTPSPASAEGMEAEARSGEAQERSAFTEEFG